MSKTLIFAHRGYSSIAPENTLSAFLPVMTDQYDGIELDVQLTKDNIPVIIHDETLDRTSNGSGYVKDYTLSQLKKLDFGSKFSSAFKNERIPTLEDFLKLAVEWNGITNIELKNNVVTYENLEQIVIDLVLKYNLVDKVLISSMDHKSLKKVMQICPEVKIGLLYDETCPKPHTYAKNFGAYSVHPYYTDISVDFVNEHIQNGIKVIPYTINSKEELQQIFSLGVSGLFSDFPTLANKISN